MSLTLRAFLFAIVLALAPYLLLGQPDRIPENLDPRDLVTIRGNVNPKAQAQLDQGPADLSLELDRITLMLKPTTDQQAALETLLRDQQDPASPDYHTWLTPEQYADRFGLSQADIDKIVFWLQSQGLTVEEVARGRNWIAFSGIVADVQAALRTEIHRYNVAGEMHFANSNEPSIPRPLAPAVSGILGLDDFYPKPLTRLLRAQRAHPDFTSGSGHFLAPDDIATIYDLTPLYNAGNLGDGQTLAVMGQSNILMSDISAFRTMFGLSSNLPTTVLVGRDPGITSDMQEADLDLEWAGAVARNANLIYVYSMSVVNAVIHTVNQNLAPIISYSFGGCEPDTGLSFAQSQQLVAQQANAQGITWVASSGDAGAAGCNTQTQTSATQGFAVNLPVSIPEVTGVGGTEFNEGSGNYWGSTNGANSGSALSYIPEQAWNDMGSTLAASGGGMSIFFSKPVWQTGPGVPSDGVRDVPDLALTASADHDGYIYCNNGSCASGNPATVVAANSIVGGTSAATPVLAGILAVLQKYQLDHGFQTAPGLGNINPTLYQLAQNVANIFHDITTGNNIVPCTVGTPNCPSSGTLSFGYTAGPGYDLVTGLGSVDAGSLVSSWHTSQCTYTLPAATTVSSHVSAFSLAIGTQSGCPWTAWTSATWISINPSAGTGSGNTSLSLATNNTTQQRSATVFVGGQIFTLTQNPSIAPDLVITSLTGPTTAVIGGSITATAVVNNLGSIASPAFRVEFYFSTSPTISTSAIDTGSGCSFAGLAVGVPTPCSISVAVPMNLTPGIWFLGAIADPTNQVVEQDESNNTRVADSGPVTVTTVPSLSITKSHSGNFSQDQQGANYVVTVSNAANAAPTSGTVTVTETVPSGLTLVSMAGPGWACVAITCTRSDALAAGTTYPAITVTVNVTATATSPQVNQVGVSGGGSATASASDSTIVAAVASPSLSIRKAHAGNFAQGQQNAVYSATVSNAANAGPSNGTVTVTDTLPSGLTLVSMTGSGWACASITCTRSDALAAGASYPPITVTVNVTAAATSPQVNQVNVSGGGSATASASDSTIITATVAPPSLSIRKTHSGNFTQGHQNAVYSVTVSNAANAGPTSGTVTVTETLPSGLTLVSIAGSGWTCASITCTRSDALAAGTSYPAVTVTVNVTATATSPQVNQVSVSGGGSATASASDSTIISVNQPTLSLSQKSLNFGVNGSLATSTQTIAVNFTNGFGVAWIASSSQPNIIVSPTSGAGNGTLQIIATAGSSGVVTVGAPGAVNSPQVISVNVSTVAPGLPYGSFDTPVSNTIGVAGAIPVTGWALDNVEVVSVGIWREPIGNETAASNGLVFLGNGTFVVGSRPDVEAAYPSAPLNYRAGWGYMLLTNLLPNNGGSPGAGNGTYHLHAIAVNRAGQTFDLGTRSITADNAHASKPFGTIDTPAQGDTVSGSTYVNFGWALTQNPYVIPTNGSTITVILDSVPVGHPTYNQFRSDIANLFPGLANSNGAVGLFFIDTTTLANGVHTISWNVFDNAGRGDGIGSRYFTVANTGNGNVSATDEPIEPTQITANATGVYSVSIEELDRIELPVGATHGYLLMKDERRPLPVGSTLKGGRFYWQPGPGFLGDYNLLFERADSTPIRVYVGIKPKSYAAQESR